MDGPIRIFVGTDERQAVAERALERSVRAHTSAEVAFTWMRAGDPGWGEEWNRGAPAGQYRPKSGRGWGTWFSCFRLAVPELCGYEGRAIYLDSDMLVLGDIRELWESRVSPSCGAAVPPNGQLDVMVFECSWWGWRELVKPAELREKGVNLAWWRRKLARHGAFGAGGVASKWDCRDDVPEGCRLLHFTAMPTQPWRPWPEAMAYREHPCRRAVEQWERWSKEV